ncbi:MAG: amino acid permease [Planctomycetes bacterium]|nr:amino acid permease [Planctomycetota bacterium]
MQSGQLQRRLGLTSAISITVGAVIGSGIFLKPLSVAQSLPSEAWIHALWIGLGLVCLFGAFAYAELGAMFPEAGGQYAFLREGWGRLTGFLYGWTFFWVINAGTVTALALAFAENLLPVFGVDMAAEAEHPFWLRIVPIAMIVVLALVNHFGVVIGALVQNVSTFAKLGALGLIVLGGFFAAGAPAPAPGVAAPAAATSLTVAGLVSAFMGIFWAYEGWYQMPFNAAELKRPERNLPLGLIGGMVILIAVYLFVNVVYLRVVPFAEMQAMPAGTASTQVATLTVARVFSPELAGYLTLLIAISIFGAANPNMLSSPRAFYAMGQDGLVPAALHRVSPRWGTPVVAIWVQAAVGVLLVLLLGTFGDTTEFVVFAAFLFYALTVAAVYRLRRARPAAERPYRCTGYPVTPALFIAVAVGFVVAVLQDPAAQKNALKGLAIVLAGLPYYFWWTRRQGAAEPPVA